MPRRAAKTFAKALRAVPFQRLKTPAAVPAPRPVPRPVVPAEESLWMLQRAMNTGELRATDALENLLARLEAMTEREDEDLQLGLDHR